MIKSKAFQRVVKVLGAIAALIFLVWTLDDFSWRWFFVICFIVMVAIILVPELFGLEWKGRGSKYDK